MYQLPDDLDDDDDQLDDNFAVYQATSKVSYRIYNSE